MVFPSCKLRLLMYPLPWHFKINLCKCILANRCISCCIYLQFEGWAFSYRYRIITPSQQTLTAFLYCLCPNFPFLWEKENLNWGLAEPQALALKSCQPGELNGCPDVYLKIHCQEILSVSLCSFSREGLLYSSWWKICEEQALFHFFLFNKKVSSWMGKRKRDRHVEIGLVEENTEFCSWPVLFWQLPVSEHLQ